MRITANLVASDTDRDLLAESVADILSNTRLLALATVGSAGGPAICNAYFAFAASAELFILTPPSTEHVRNLTNDPRVAVAIADSQQTGDSGKRGIQVTGTGGLASGSDLLDGLAAYRERFPATRDVLASPQAVEASGMESRLFVIKPVHVKVFDERVFGAEVWISAEVES